MRMNAMFITNLTINTVRHLKNINIELSQERKKTPHSDREKREVEKSSVLEAVRTFLRDREYDKGNVRPVESPSCSDGMAREGVKGEVIVVFRDGRNQAPTGAFLQQLVKLQTEKKPLPVVRVIPKPLPGSTKGSPD